MSWTDKYWDCLDQLYWHPAYLGLKSINRNKWEIDGDRVSIPKSLVNMKGALYSRPENAKNNLKNLKQQEEITNHIFDLTFGILDGKLIYDIFNPYIITNSPQDFTSIGREIIERLSLGGNVTQQDGFFVGQDAILAVELKFNAKTSFDQLAKYFLLFMKEEEFSGPKEEMTLLYIFNSNPKRTFIKAFGDS